LEVIIAATLGAWSHASQSAHSKGANTTWDSACCFRRSATATGNTEPGSRLVQAARPSQAELMGEIQNVTQSATAQVSVHPKRRVAAALPTSGPARRASSRAGRRAVAAARWGRTTNT